MDAELIDMKKNKALRMWKYVRNGSNTNTCNGDLKNYNKINIKHWT